MHSYITYIFFKETKKVTQMQIYANVGASIFVCIIMVAIMVFMHKRKRRNRSKFKEVMVGKPGKFNPGREWKSQLSTISYDSARELPKSAFIIGEEIGSGNFGKVNKGKLKALAGTKCKSSIAIKSTSPLTSPPTPSWGGFKMVPTHSMFSHNPPQ